MFLFRSVAAAVGVVVAGCAAQTVGTKPGVGDMGKPNAPELSMIILAVEDVERAARFYESAFGWPRRTDVPVLVEFELPDGRGLAVYQAKGFAGNTGRMPPALGAYGTSGVELYLQCEELDACIVRLKDAGARVLAGKSEKPWGDEAAYFADPDGNVVAVGRKLGRAPREDEPAAIEIEKKVMIYASAQEVYDAWTTHAGVTSFFAPDARIDLRPGGAYEMYFMPSAPEGSRGGEGCTVIEFTPGAHVAFTWNFPPTLPTIRDEHTRVDLDFVAIDGEITEVTLRQSGFKTGGEWPEGVEYFERAWDVVLDRLVHRFRIGPVNWDQL